MAVQLIAFDVACPPQALERFLNWHASPLRNLALQEYCSPSVCQPALQQWYREMSAVFPCFGEPALMNDTEARPPLPELHLSYAFDTWAVGVTLPGHTEELAQRHAASLANTLGLVMIRQGGSDPRVWWPVLNEREAP